MAEENITDEAVMLNIKRVAMDLLSKANEIETVVVAFAMKGENGGAYCFTTGRNGGMATLVCMLGATVCSREDVASTDLTSRDN